MKERTVSAKQAASAKARDRRRELDVERDAQDRRIEEAAAAALLALDGRAEAEAALVAATAAVGAEVRAVLAEGASPERAAALLDLDVAEVRRLSKVTSAGPGNTDTGASRPDGAGDRSLTVVGGEDAARQTG